MSWEMSWEMSLEILSPKKNKNYFLKWCRFIIRNQIHPSEDVDDSGNT
jgi:hypothetical protein